jgi:hypothetical protein
MESGDYRTYEVAAHFSGDRGLEYYHQVNRFVYTIYSSIGFQEFTRQDCREWIRAIDNGENTWDRNPAYRFGRALSKIYVYPTRPDMDRGQMDIRDKIHHGMNALWNAYQNAKAMGDIPLFFQNAFANDHCFDARVSTFQRFMERYLAIPDFNVDIGLRANLDHRVLEHFRVCQNLQIMKFAREHNMPYKAFKHWVISVGADGIAPGQLNRTRDIDGNRIDGAQRVQINGHLQQFYAEYFRPQDFEAYLTQNQQPLRTLVNVWEPREARMVMKAQGPVLQRGNPERPRQPEVAGWDPILRRSGMWPDVWGA